MVAVEETTAEKATATENGTKAPKDIEAAAGKYQWDDRTGSDADQEVQSDAFNNYVWSDGKKTVSISVLSVMI